MRLELRLLMFQVIVVRIVVASLKCLAFRFPMLAELAEQGPLSQGTLEPIERAHLLGIKRPHAMLLQARAQLIKMLSISRFDSAQDVHGGNVRAGESAVVQDLFDAGAG